MMMRYWWSSRDVNDMKKLILTIIAFTVVNLACSSAAPKMTVTVGEKTMSYNIKDGKMLKLQQGSGDNAKAQYQIHLATFDLTKTSDVSKPLTENGQAVISIEVYDKKGTTRDTVPMPTTFPAKSNDFAEANFGSAFISYFEDGKLVRKTPADFSVENKDKEGAVKFTSVSGDTVTGEIDLTLGNKGKFKGNFTAKIVGKEF